MSYPPTTFNMPKSNYLSLAFFLFGLLNNVIYVVILSAASDLVDSQSTPKGVILFANIFPALLVKFGWPYFISGQIRYQKRIISCSTLSFGGLLIVALSESLGMRLAGIGIASFSSGLGEMTFLQLSTIYGNEIGGIGISWFASGTGGAGLVGAGLWWTLRGLGTKLALLLCSVLPLGMTAAYYLLLPPTSHFTQPLDSYSSVPIFDSDEPELSSDPTTTFTTPSPIQSLSITEKFNLAKPLFLPYMIPLFLVYLAEYTINTGVAPTLIYPLPTEPPLSLLLTSLRDFYPLYQLIYQTFVFFSRSSISFSLPPLPPSLLALPTYCQLLLLTLLTLESSHSILSSILPTNKIIPIIFFLIAMEGIFGGLAYVNIFHRLATLSTVENSTEAAQGGGGGGGKKVYSKEEKAFLIASVGFSDTLGILGASLLSMGLEPILCELQRGGGRVPGCL